MEIETERHLPRDRVDHLNPEQSEAWRRFLCSIATTESTEEALISPLNAYFSTPQILRQLEWHARDEVRHAEMLKVYVKTTFAYEKTERTLSDRWIYDRALPWIARKWARYPLPFLSALYFFEWFSESFYRDLIGKARDHGLARLAEMLGQIERDEIGHRQGLEQLFRQVQAKHHRVTHGELLACWVMRTIIRLDLSLAPWAFYNRHVRLNLIALGMDPKAFAAAAQSNLKRARERVLEARRS